MRYGDVCCRPEQREIVRSAFPTGERTGENGWRVGGRAICRVPKRVERVEKALAAAGRARNIGARGGLPVGGGEDHGRAARSSDHASDSGQRSTSADAYGERRGAAVD